MKQIISLYFGGTGINLCSSLLDHYQFEENITDEGSCGLNIAQSKFYNESLFDKSYSDVGSEEHGDDEYSNYENDYTYKNPDLNRSKAERDETISNFYETSDGKVKSLSVLVDSDTFDIEKIMAGKKKQLFDPDQFIYGKENSSGNYSRGENLFKTEKEKFENSVRRLVERCDNLVGFAYHFSAVSGSSGAACSRLDSLKTEHEKLSHIVFPVFQDIHHNLSSVEIFNSIFVARAMIEKSSMGIVYNNDSLKRYLYTQQIEFVTNQLLNSLMAHSISLFTAGCRRGGSLA